MEGATAAARFSMIATMAVPSWVTRNRRDRLRDIERVYVEDDEPTAQETAPAVGMA